MSFYIAPHTGQAAPPSPVTPDQVRQWSAETEIDSRTGAARRGGTMSVTAASSTDERAATALREKLRAAGFPAVLGRARASGATRYEVCVGSLPDAIEASTLAQRLQTLGYAQARATR